MTSIATRIACVGSGRSVRLGTPQGTSENRREKRSSGESRRAAGRARDRKERRGEEKRVEERRGEKRNGNASEQRVFREQRWFVVLYEYSFTRNESEKEIRGCEM